MLQGMSLTLASLRSEDIEGTEQNESDRPNHGLDRQDEALKQLVLRLLFEPGVSSVSWAVYAEVPELASQNGFVSHLADLFANL
jgi:hypothetical protein